MPLKILITGATSLMGERLRRLIRCETDWNTVSLVREPKKTLRLENEKLIQCSVTDLKNLKKICYEERPDVIINTSVLFCPVACEKDHKLTWDLNVVSTEWLTSICRVIESHLILLSSEEIFPCDRGPYYINEAPNPVGYLGKSRHAAENLVLAGVDKGTIIRLTRLFGASAPGRNNFISDWISKADKKENIICDSNYYTNPSFTEDVALVIIRAIERKKYGIYHTGCPEWISEFEQAKIVAREFAFENEIQAIPISKEKKPNIIKAGLVTLETEMELGVKFSHFVDALSAMRFQIIENTRIFR